MNESLFECFESIDGFCLDSRLLHPLVAGEEVRVERRPVQGIRGGRRLRPAALHERHDAVEAGEEREGKGKSLGLERFTFSKMLNICTQKCR